jgi:hypothetical protein
VSQSKLRWNPALTTIVFVLGVVVGAALLSWVTQLGSDTDEKLVESGPFRTWVAVAAFAVVAFVDTLLAGVRELRSDRLRSSALSAKVYGWLFLAFAAIVVIALRNGGRGGPPVDIQYWRAISLGVLLLGAAAAGPWVVSVWASHDVLSNYRGRILAFPSATSTTTPSYDLDDMMALLLDIRKLIAAAVGRLLILVLGAVLLSGALRAALVPRFISEDGFPASAVLMYGAFFTVMLSLAVLPLMRAWRQTATMLLDQAYPVRVATSADDAAARDRMAQRLNLDGALFTSPVTLTSLLAPLVTSFLAVFIPQIGN